MHYKIIGFLLVAAACAVANAALLPRNLDEYLSSVVVLPKSYPKEAELRKTNWEKYNKALNMMTQPNYGCVVRQASGLYDVDPVAILGSIIAEHTYNVNVWDMWGERFVSMQTRWIKRFEGNNINLIEMLAEPAYMQCSHSVNSSYDLWECYDSVWRKDARNVKGSNAIKWTFFNPLGTGFTYGVGQLGPDRALMVTDIVHEISRLPILDPADPTTLYEHILNPQKSIHYVAASILVSIQIYKDLARIDVSENPGVLATLYNLGKEKSRAKQRFNENVRALKAQGQFIFPTTNQLGTLINYKQDEIRAVYQQKILSLTEQACRSYQL